MLSGQTCGCFQAGEAGGEMDKEARQQGKGKEGVLARVTAGHRCHAQVRTIKAKACL